MNWNLIFNPFAKKADKFLILVGIFTFFIGCYISWRFEMVYDGIFDVHYVPLISYINAFLGNTINVITLCIFVFGLAKIINPKTRMIDILNAAFLSRIPIYLITIFSNLPVVLNFTKKIEENISNLQDLQLTTGDIVTALVFSVFSLLMLAYSIVLIVNGFKTASNAKKWQHFVGLAVVILIVEIISKMLVINL